jgi:hypothetical protein
LGGRAAALSSRSSEPLQTAPTPRTGNGFTRHRRRAWGLGAEREPPGGLDPLRLPEYASDHDRIAACRRAFRFASQHARGAKVKTSMLRSNGAPIAVVGYLDIPVTKADLGPRCGGSSPYAGGALDSKASRRRRVLAACISLGYHEVVNGSSAGDGWWRFRAIEGR